MNRSQLLCAVLCIWFAAACAQTPGKSAFAPTQLKDFPRSTLTVQRQNGRDTFQIWIADTPQRHQQGLMWIRELPADHGMLFILQPTREMNMWMKNTYVPLDMLFVAPDGRILNIAHNTKPLSTDIVSSGVVVGGVVEILAGESKRRGIQIGDRVIHPLLAGPGSR
jgi:uncharacterized membrane protein (UPF0127 family)